ncbi:MAG: response regulator [Bacteroidia bacterium]|nr:response regulator [Bacteroidia bacterium]
MPKKILLVEDDEINLMIAEHILTRAGYEVSTADNGETAVEQACSAHFDLILMDIEMPVMDGVEATARIRSRPEGQAAPIVALTAHTLPEKLEEFMAAGMNDYLIKPFDGHKFQPIADKYLI